MMEERIQLAEKEGKTIEITLVPHSSIQNHLDMKYSMLFNRLRIRNHQTRILPAFLGLSLPK